MDDLHQPEIKLHAFYLKSQLEKILWNVSLRDIQTARIISEAARRTAHSDCKSPLSAPFKISNFRRKDIFILFTNQMDGSQRRLFLKVDEARLYIASSNGALSQATSTPFQDYREYFCQTRRQEKALKTSEAFARKVPQKLPNRLWKSFVRMRTYAICVAENGNTKYGSTHTIASFLDNGLF